MRSVTVTASRSYDVLIGTGLMDQISEYTARIPNVRKVCIVSDTNVWPLYGENISRRLTEAKYHVHQYVFPAGEASKNSAVCFDLLNHLAAWQLTRSDLIIALGGGVVGDLAGFAASIYLRGIPYIQLPTTLLAAVDSSVGGKTAIDLPCGKNLAGSFYQPQLVLCDTRCLKTLPDSVFLDGCAEVIKYAVAYDEDLFAHLLKHGLDFDREQVITRCVELKRDVVAEDEFDTGIRMKLNLGHTIGHGIEKLSNFTISHGHAVAIGLATVARIGCCRGICEGTAAKQIINLLNLFGLPVYADYCAKDLTGCAMSDKKRMGDTVNFIVPERIGSCRIVPVPTEKIKAFIEAGL